MLWHYTYVVDFGYNTKERFENLLLKFYERLTTDPLQFPKVEGLPFTRMHLLHENVKVYYYYKPGTEVVEIDRFFYTHQDPDNLRV